MGPIKYHVKYLRLIFCNHALFPLKGGLKHVKIIFNRRE